MLRQSVPIWLRINGASGCGSAAPRQAVITDIAGNVATYEMLKAGRQAAQAEKAEDSLPTTHKELDQTFGHRVSPPVNVGPSVCGARQ